VSAQIAEAGAKIAEALRAVVAETIESSGNSSSAPDLQALLWDWDIKASYLLKILYEMGERGWSCSIESEWQNPDALEVYRLSDYPSPREFAKAAHTWHNSMDMVDYHFFKEDDAKARDWLLWIPENKGEELADYLCDRGVDEIDGIYGSQYEGDV